MSDLASWIALTLMPGLRPAVYPRFLERFPDPPRALGSPRTRFGPLPEAFIEACSVHWRDFVLKSRGVITTAAKKGMTVLTLEDPSYPERLRQIDDPPLVLYTLGQILPRDNLAVAVVGTRSPTATGRVVAERMGRDLASAGVTLVSGMARGIDSSVHGAALEAGGRTVAVTGCGLDVAYPREQKALLGQVCASGWAVSEYAPGTPPLKWHFLERNRILSGLSIGVVVVEAGLKSGALSTAGHALTQGRPVMAVPGSVLNPAAAGTNRLLADGAGLVTCAADVLCFLRRETEFVPDIRGKEGLNARVTLEEGEILRILGEGIASRDEILRRSPFPPGKTSALVSSLEVKGLVKALPGGRLARK